MSVTTINETDRRGFLLQMTAAGAAATAAASIPGRLSAAGETKSHDQAVQLKSRPDVIVYQRRGYQLKRQGTYPAWPWVARAGDGRLVCVFREGTRHNVNPAPRPPEVLMWTESSDEGRSWTPARVMVDPDGTAERNANVASLPDASLMVAYNVHTPDLSYRAAMAVFSHDGGASWTAPVVVHEGGGTRGAAIGLASGDILLPIYTHKGGGGSRGNCVAMRSSDMGKTWEAHPLPNPHNLPGDEWCIAEVEPGRVVGITHFREQEDGRYFKTESGDGGRNWEVLTKTNVSQPDPAIWPGRNGGPPQLDMHGKIPVLTYPDHRLLSVSMTTTTDPEFLNWDVAGQVNCYRYPEEISDGGYPCSVAIGEHRRLVIDYEIRAGNTVDGMWIAGYFVDLPSGWF